jgi:hypothetical protein
MGSDYIEVIIHNVGNLECYLDIARVELQRIDGADGNGDLRPGKLPIALDRNVEVNTVDRGIPQARLRPNQQIAFTAKWTNRTGYTDTDVCATKMRIILDGRPPLILTVAADSCDSRVFMTGFHQVRK